MTSDVSTDNSRPASALSMFERAAHFPTVLLALALLLALDFWMSLGYNSNLLSLSWDFVQQHATIGHALIFFVTFGLYMSIGIHIVKAMVDPLVQLTILPIWQKLLPEEEGIRSPYSGAVRPWKLHKAAHIEQNKFYLDCYSEYEAIRREREKNEWHTSATAFACLLLGGINYALLPKLGHLSLSQALATDFPVVWEWVFWLLLSLLLVIWLMPILRDRHAGEWVYCMSLYQKLEDEKRRAREQGMLPKF